MFSVGKGGLNNQRYNLRLLVDGVPKSRARASVATEHQRLPTGAGHGIAAGRHHVVCRQCSKAALPQAKGLPQRERAEHQIGSSRTGYAAEVGPHVMIEDVLPQRLYDFRQGMNCQGLCPHGTHTVEYERQGTNMIEVGMSQQDMINFDHVFERQIDRPSTGIDQYVVVHAKAGSTQQGAANASRALVAAR